MSQTSELLATAERAAHAAGAELLARYDTDHAVDAKTSATDPVSDADRASEQVLVDTLLAARPEDGLLGEEGAQRRGTSGLRWVVDPLDGTVNYLYRFPAWAVSVACEDDHGALVGAVHDPLRGETFTAVRDEGARLNGRPLAVRDPVSLDRALVATGFGYAASLRAHQGAVAAELVPRVRDIRRAGSCALDLSSLAAGRVDGYYELGVSHWDWAAAVLIAAEAGATVRFYRDAVADREGLVAAGPALYDALRDAVAG